MPELLTRLAIETMERGLLPDFLMRYGIRRLCAERLKEESAPTTEEQDRRTAEFIEKMDEAALAPAPRESNEQHYEVPPEFFLEVLGPHLKYSSGYWPDGLDDLAGSEAAALEETCGHADLSDGIDILELGCGWGSLTLFMAEKYPASSITAVSNSSDQRRFIEEQARERGLTNIRIVTCDMNEFDPGASFNRIVSVEMFEHMRNWRELLGKVSTWLEPGGRLFIHIFTHRSATYSFETEGADNWMGRYFFTGGLMPGQDLILNFLDNLELVDRWTWAGTHYEKTSNAWIARMDLNRDRILPVLEKTYGKAESRRWFQRWRMFFMACAELFGFNNGKEWPVSHYLLERKS